MSSTAPQLPPAGAGAPEPENEVRLTFMEHLRDLRKRLTHAILGVLVGMLAVGGFVDGIFHWLMPPVRAALPPNQQLLHYTGSIQPLIV